jgi:membrane protein required for colicin V production
LKNHTGALTFDFRSRSIGTISDLSSMIIDLIFALLLVLAIFKGYRRGLIVGVFSFVSVIVGLAAAVKLSAVVAGYIGHAVNVSDKWLPVISFIVVFVGIVLLIRLGANLVQKSIEIAALGWANRLGGILFYTAIFIIIYSILLFYAEKINLLRPATIENSVTYSFIQPWGPKIIDSLGSLVPIFKDMFTELEAFFSGVAQKIPEKS